MTALCAPGDRSAVRASALLWSRAVASISSVRSSWCVGATRTRARDGPLVCRIDHLLRPLRQRARRAPLDVSRTAARARRGRSLGLVRDSRRETSTPSSRAAFEALLTALRHESRATRARRAMACGTRRMKSWRPRLFIDRRLDRALTRHQDFIGSQISLISKSGPSTARVSSLILLRHQMFGDALASPR